VRVKSFLQTVKRFLQITKELNSVIKSITLNILFYSNIHGLNTNIMAVLRVNHVKYVTRSWEFNLDNITIISSSDFITGYWIMAMVQKKGILRIK
jgi:hypothetical protein